MVHRIARSDRLRGGIDANDPNSDIAAVAANSPRLRAAPTKPCYVKILLANSEPSTHGRLSKMP
jgi:hypothetical protein